MNFLKGKLEEGNQIEKIQNLTEDIYKKEQEINTIIENNRKLQKEFILHTKIFNAHKNELDQAHLVI